MKNEILGFDYEPIQGQRLRRVLGNAPLNCDDGSVVFDDIRLHLDKCSLVFSVDLDTDEIICTLFNETDDEDTTWVDVNALAPYINSDIGWLWVGRNWLGYADTVTLSFAGIEPSLMLVGVASKLNLYRLDKLGTDT